MRLTKMENGVPKRMNFKLKWFFEDFLNMNVKVARVDFDEDDYKSYKVARGVLATSAKRHSVPVKVVVSEKKVYLVRTDM